MTEEQMDYLADLDALEGVGAHKKDVPTSKYYGITDNGLHMITNTIRRKDNDGNYMENALKTRSLLSQAILKVLDENTVWVKNKKGEGYLKSAAKVNQIAKFGKEGMAELALAIRDINLRKIPQREAEPLREDTINSILLTAHNRPLVLSDEDFTEPLKSGSETDISHVFLQNLKGVNKDYIEGIKKRQAACWNSFRADIPPREAIKLIDKGMITNKNRVNQIYAEENERYGKKQLKEFKNQAIDSKISNNDTARLISDDEAAAMLYPLDKQPRLGQEPSFWQTLGEIARKAYNVFYGQNSTSNNQFANMPENMLNRENGEQK